jgi:MFS family permease
MDTPTRGRPAVSLLLTSVAFFMVALDALVVITALPAIHAQLGGSMATLEWAVNAYGLTFAAGIVTSSALGDRLGRRPVYVAGLILFSAASAACALAPTAATLIAARAVQGVGAAIVTPLSLTILTSAFPAAKRGAVVGIWGGIAGLAVAGGPLVGGGVVQGLSWHWIFWVNVPIGFAAAVASARLLPESHGPARRLDLPALPLIAFAALALTWGLGDGPLATGLRVGRRGGHRPQPCDGAGRFARSAGQGPGGHRVAVIGPECSDLPAVAWCAAAGIWARRLGRARR